MDNKDKMKERDVSKGWSYDQLLLIGIVLISIAFLSYTAYRSYILSFVHDEGISFTIISKYGNYIYWASSANNHVLNTILMKVFSLAFGNSELSLRFPNLIGHLFFAIFSFLILKKVQNNYLVLCGFILLNSNPFVLDFFSLARGYGLALSFMMGSIYFLIREKFFYTFLFGALAVLSNYTLLNYYLSSLFIIVLLQFYNAVGVRFNVGFYEIKGLIKKNGLSIFFNIIFLAAIIPTLFDLRRRGEFYVGGKEGFWNSTVRSLIDSSFYFKDYNNIVKDLICLIVAITAVSSIIIILYQFFRIKEFKPSSIILLVMIFSIISPIAQHVLLNTLYPIERTGLYYIPLFILLLIFTCSEAIQIMRESVKIIIFLFLFFFCGVAIFHFVGTANFKYTYTWAYDANTKAMMLEDLHKAYHENYKGERISIKINSLFGPAINYYRITRDMQWLEPITKRNQLLTREFDFYYCFINEELSIAQNRSISILKYYPDTDTILSKLNKTKS